MKSKLFYYHFYSHKLKTCHSYIIHPVLTSKRKYIFCFSKTVWFEGELSQSNLTHLIVTRLPVKISVTSMLLLIYLGVFLDLTNNVFYESSLKTDSNTNNGIWHILFLYDMCYVYNQNSLD